MDVEHALGNTRLTAGELNNISAGVGPPGTAGDGNGRWTSFGSKPGGVGDGATPFGSKPGGVGDGFV